MRRPRLVRLECSLKGRREVSGDWIVEVMSVRRRERLTEKGTNREEGKHAECGRQSDKQSGREADARSVERMV